MSRFRRVRARFLWEPRDLWIGVYWDARPLLLNIYVCLIPCFPLLIQVWRGRIPR